MIGRSIAWHTRRWAIRLFAERHVMAVTGGEHVGEIRLDANAVPHRITRAVRSNDNASWPVTHLYGVPTNSDDRATLVWMRVSLLVCGLMTGLLAVHLTRAVL